MAEKHLSKRPRPLALPVNGQQAWWYEEAFGISVCVATSRHPTTAVVRIPWRSIRASLARLDRGAKEPQP